MTPAELTAMREAAGLNQRQLGRLLEVHFQTVWRWEHGERNISPQMAHWIKNKLTEYSQQPS